MVSSSRLAAWRARAAEPADVSGLVAFRVLFGLVVAAGAVRFIALGWVERFFVRPTFFFPYWGAPWARALPEPWMTAAFVAIAVLGVMVAVGALYRVASILLFVIFTYVELIDVTSYLNHYYLVSLVALLLACLPLHRAMSVDAWLRPSLRVGAFPRWMTWLLRFQVGVVYVFAGIAKMQPDWLVYGQPLGIWLASRSETPVIGGLFGEPWVAIAMAWAAMLYDTTIALWLSLPRTRLAAYGALVGFHACVGALFDIGMFPVIMIALALVFFEPDWPRRLLRRRAATPAPSWAPSGPAWGQRLAVALIAVYCAAQVAIPLRAFAYGGDVLWHEQGMRWSWRVMVREKNGAITYRVRARGWTHERFVSPSRYLTRDQEREMQGQPDMILSLAHHIAAELRERGAEDVEVRVDAMVSLNGRPMARLIDPEVDLAGVEAGLASATWILPAPATAPAPIARRTLIAGRAP